MREVYDGSLDSFKDSLGGSNQILMDAYIDLQENTFDYVNDLDIVEDLIHTIRTYDNMRRRKLNELLTLDGPNRDIILGP